MILSVYLTRETVRAIYAIMEPQRPCRLGKGRLTQYAQESPTPEEVIEDSAP
jgi:hypothetical protein